MGRPSNYTPEIVAAICEQMSEGLSLRSVCKMNGMPHVSTVMRWLADEANESFREQYARACELRADVLADEILTIADDASRDVVEVGVGYQDEDGNERTREVERFTSTARDKIRIDSRKWLLSKLAPKKYGDRLALTGADGGAVKVDLTDARNALLSKLAEGEE